MKFLLLNALAWAQENGAEHATEAVTIPWSNIWAQAVNLFFLVGLLVYFLRHAVKQHFAQRAAEYREMVDRAEAARKEAEENRAQATARLQKLEAGAEQSAATAKSESEALRQRLVNEAKNLSQRLAVEAQRTAAVELEKARLELRRELLGKALSTAGENLKKNLGSVEQKKLQNEFAEKIEVVGG